MLQQLTQTTIEPGTVNLDNAIDNGKEYLQNISEQIVRCFFTN